MTISPKHPNFVGGFTDETKNRIKNIITTQEDAEELLEAFKSGDETAETIAMLYDGISSLKNQDLRKIFITENEEEISSEIFLQNDTSENSIREAASFAYRLKDSLNINTTVLTSLVRRQIQRILKEEDLDLRAYKIITLRNLIACEKNDDAIFTAGIQHDSAEFLEPLTEALFANRPIYLKNTKQAIDQNLTNEVKVGGSSFNMVPLELIDENDTSINNLLKNHQLPKPLKDSDNVRFIVNESLQSLRTTETNQILIDPNSTEIILHAKRFSFDGTGSKLATKLLLDENEEITLSFINSEEDPKGFEPTAFVVHESIQKTLENGHYVTYVKETDEKWYLYNDSGRSLQTEEQVSEAKQDAYIIKYSLVGSDLPNEQAPSKNLGNTCYANAALAFIGSLESCNLIDEKEVDKLDVILQLEDERIQFSRDNNTIPYSKEHLQQTIPLAWKEINFVTEDDEQLTTITPEEYAPTINPDSQKADPTAKTTKTTVNANSFQSAAINLIKIGPPKNLDKIIDEKNKLPRIQGEQEVKKTDLQFYKYSNTLNSKSYFSTTNKGINSELDKNKQLELEQNIVKIALKKARDVSGITDEVAAIFTLIAIKNNGIFNQKTLLLEDLVSLKGKSDNDYIKNTSDDDLKKGAIKFSKNFQDEMKTVGMYTGNQNAKSLVGRRLKRVSSESVLDLLNNDNKVFYKICEDLGGLDKIKTQCPPNVSIEEAETTNLRSSHRHM